MRSEIFSILLNVFWSYLRSEVFMNSMLSFEACFAVAVLQKCAILNCNWIFKVKRACFCKMQFAKLCNYNVQLDIKVLGFYRKDEL